MTANSFMRHQNARSVVGAVIVAVLVLVVLSLAFKYYPASSPPRMVVGIVQSSQAHYFGKLQGGWRETATVRLTDGKFVLAYVKFAEPVSAGDAVTLSVQPRMGSDPLYKVAAKNNH